MKKTANYDLNQWEKSDRIMMEDFNADNVKIDGALKANAAAVSAEEAARKAAITSEANARAAAVQAARDACPLVLLRTVVTNAEANQIDLSLAGLDWEKYGDILIYMRLRLGNGGGTFTYVTVRLNNNDGNYYTTPASGTRNFLMDLTADIYGIDFCCRIPRGKSGFGTEWSGFRHTANFPYFFAQTACLLGSSNTQGQVTSMNFISSSTKFAVGCKFTILGVRA